MENLPEKINQNLPVIQKVANNIMVLRQRGAKRIEILREMLNLADVAKTLSNIEKQIFVSATKKEIAEIAEFALVEKTSTLMEIIAKDTGYIIQSKEDWTYTCMRILDIMKKYYSDMTLSDIKLAFELTVIGQLDEFLPKDNHGNAERKHYQNFSIEYFSKIMNAYKQKKNETINKAYLALPQPEKDFTPQEKAKARNNILEKCREIFLLYQKNKILELGVCGDLFVYDWLIEEKLTEPAEISEEDRVLAYNNLINDVITGRANRFQVHQIRKEGINHPDLNYPSFNIARRKKIQETFDKMIENKINIEDYLHFQEIPE